MPALKKICLADDMPYSFPFIAMLKGNAADFKRYDTPVTVLGFSGMEKHYLRVKTESGSITVASDSMLYVEVNH